MDIKCKATKTNGDPCSNPPRVGQEVCGAHGGAAPKALAAARRRLITADLLGESRRAGCATTTTRTRLDKLLVACEIQAAGRSPAELLLDVVYRAHAMVQYLGACVGMLAIPGDELAEDQRPVFVHEGANGQQVDPAVRLYGQWLDRAAQASKMALDAGVAERLVQVEQEKGRLLAQVINSVLEDTDLALTETQRAAGKGAAARHLRALAAG